MGWCKECVTTQKVNVLSFLPSFISLSVSRVVLSLFQSQFSKQRYLLSSHSISSIPSFPSDHPVDAYVFFAIFLSLPTFHFSFHAISCSIRQFTSKIWPIKLHFLLFILCTLLLSSLNIRNVSSFPTQLNELSFSVRLENHISHLSIYFYLIFCVFKLQHQTNHLLQFSSLLVSFEKLRLICFWK